MIFFSSECEAVMAECFDVGIEAKEVQRHRTPCLRLPTSSLFTPESAEKALTLRPQASDVILSSYPRCDSRCVDSIVWKLLYTDLKQPPLNRVTERFLPCLEMNTEEDLSDIHEHVTRHRLPKLYKTHFPFSLIPFCRRSKYIYVIRSPWEACSAYYRFLVSLGSASGSFDAFFGEFMEGNVPYGSYFKHVAPWNKRTGESNVLILCREHVEHNPRSALYKIAAFLGDRYLKLLLSNEELEKDILRDVSEWEKPADSRNRVPDPCAFDFDDPLRDETGHDSVDEEVTRALKRPVCSEQQLNEIIKKISQHFNNSSIEFLWLSLFQKQLPILVGQLAFAVR